MIGPYRLLHLLGQGGMSRVYAAEPVGGGERVALKVLRQELTADRRAVRRFLAEARAVARLGHPHIVALRDAGQAEEGPVYFALELLEGETLGTRLRREGALGVEPALTVAVQVADALASAHQAGVLHRDVKPENVFLVAGTDGPVAKLLDFGIAKIAGERVSTDRRTGQGAALGTVEYMAPEQCVGAEIDARSDVYALGVMLYHHMLVGELPYRATSPGSRWCSGTCARASRPSTRRAPRCRRASRRSWRRPSPRTRASGRPAWLRCTRRSRASCAR